MLAQTINAGAIDTSAYSNIYNQALPNENNFQEQSVYCNNNKSIDELISEFGNKIAQNSGHGNTTNNFDSMDNKEKYDDSDSSKHEKNDDSESKNDFDNSSNDINSYYPVENNTPIANSENANTTKKSIERRIIDVKKITNNNNPYHIEGHEESPLEKQYNEIVLNKLDIMKDDVIEEADLNKSFMHPSIQRVHVFTTNEMSSNSRPSSAQSTGSIGHVKEMISDHICPECQNQLLKIYDHCLSSKEYMYPPLNSLNENRLGKYQTNPPYFEYFDKKANPFTQAELRVWEKEDGKHHNQNNVKNIMGGSGMSINVPASSNLNINSNQNLDHHGTTSRRESRANPQYLNTEKQHKKKNFEETMDKISDEILKETIVEGRELKNKNQLYTLDLPNCPYYKDTIHKIIREKHQQDEENEKMNNEGGYRNGIIGELGLNGFKHGGVFSGALAKSYIALKKKENSKIKDEYYELRKGYKEEIITSGALQTALRKSMKYYIFAEEWQELQSERLKDFVRLLKIELSSLLAFLINSESKLSKTSYILEIEKNKAKERDDQVFELQHELISVKEKLKNTYKECLDLNSTVCILEDEAKNGTKVLQEKNDILRNSMKKLSKNYNICENLLKSKIKIIQDLEFELSQFVIQCNEQNQEIARWKKLKCEADSKATIANSQIEILQDKYEKEIIRYDHIKDLKEGVDIELAAEKKQHQIDNSKNELEIKKLKNDFNEKQNMINRLIVEKERERSDYQKLLLTKTRLEESLSSYKDKYMKETLAFEADIKKYKEICDNDREIISAFSEKVEKLESQATTLEAQHAKDVVTITKMGIENSTMKKLNGEIKKSFNDYVRKSNQAKAVEVKEKKQLLEMIKLLKDKNRQKSEENALLKMKSNENDQNFKTIIEQYEQKIVEKEQIIEEKESQIKEEKEKSLELIEVSSVEEVQSEMVHSHSPKTDHKVKEQIVESKQFNNSQNKEEKEQYENEIAKLKEEKLEVQKKFDSLNQKINEVLEELTKLKEEHNCYVKEKHSEILDYTKKIRDLEEKNEFYQNDYITKVKENDWLIKNLKFTKDILSQEVTIKENMKSRYLEMKELLNNERLENLENSTVKRRSKHIYSEIKYNYFQRMEERNKRFEYITSYLNKEKDRLSSILNFLPESLNQEKKQSRKELKEMME